eukprot:13076599-Ditylum_brightwellii.AAC.1
MRDQLFKQKRPATSPNSLTSSIPQLTFIAQTKSNIDNEDDTSMSTTTYFTEENSSKQIDSLVEMYPEQEEYITGLLKRGLSADQVAIRVPTLSEMTARDLS